MFFNTNFIALNITYIYAYVMEHKLQHLMFSEDQLLYAYIFYYYENISS
jgi:hypothetical protein